MCEFSSPLSSLAKSRMAILLFIPFASHLRPNIVYCPCLFVTFHRNLVTRLSVVQRPQATKIMVTLCLVFSAQYLTKIVFITGLSHVYPPVHLQVVLYLISIVLMCISHSFFAFEPTLIPIPLVPSLRTKSNANTVDRRAANTFILSHSPFPG